MILKEVCNKEICGFDFFRLYQQDCVVVIISNFVFFCLLYFKYGVLLR